MSIWFDHVIVACRDLDAAAQRFRAMGFDVTYGGRHDKNGTHNALVRFGLDYIEILSVFDEAIARASGAGRAALLDFLDANPSGDLIGFTLTTADSAALAEKFRRQGLEVTGPIVGQRRRPDGNVLEFRPLLIGDLSWRRPWPFFVQWVTSDDLRLAWEPPGKHTNGISGIRALSIAATELETLTSLYEGQFGLPITRIEDRVDLAARCAVIDLQDGVRLELLAPTGPGRVKERLDRVGAGVYGIRLASVDLARTRERLGESGLRVGEASDGSLAIDARSISLGPDLRIAADASVGAAA